MCVTVFARLVPLLVRGVAILGSACGCSALGLGSPVSLAAAASVVVASGVVDPAGACAAETMFTAACPCVAGIDTPTTCSGTPCCEPGRA